MVVGDLDIELEQLKKQNEILRLQKENKKIQDELAGNSSRRHESPMSPQPRCHGRSYPPSHYPMDDGYYCPPPREDGHRRSYPPPPTAPRGRPPQGLRCYDDGRGCSPCHHGGHYGEECGDYCGGYHHRR